MNAFVIGASGYLGGGAARAIKDAGQAVVAAARTPETAAKLSALGYVTVESDVTRPESLLEPTRAADGVVYAVQLNQADAEEVDAAALRAIIGVLAHTSKTLLYTSGVWYYGSTGDRVADEETPPNPPPTAAGRPRLERIVLDAAQQGVRSIVLRPGMVFGEAKGIPAMYVGSARTTGVARTIGDGANRWPSIHVADLARLYLLALEKGEPGDVFNVADDTTFTQLEIAQAASRGAGRGGATNAWPIDQARAALGDWIANLALDQRVSSERARRRLGWAPREATIVEDLERGSYVSAAR